MILELLDTFRSNELLPPLGMGREKSIRKYIRKRIRNAGLCAFDWKKRKKSMKHFSRGRERNREPHKVRPYIEPGMGKLQPIRETSERVKNSSVTQLFTPRAPARPKQ